MSWKQAYLETRILSADPVELVSILYEYAAMSVQDARESLAAKDVPGRARAVTKAIAIVGELEGSLNREQGGEIAANLGRLYPYMRDRLTQANITQTDEPLAEVEALLKTLGEGWKEIAGSALGAQRISTNHIAGAGESWSSGTVQGWDTPPLVESTGYSSQGWSA
ncbi:MAG TPA: flagellar export chaperone FliS [Bryobacteraceae bacterium]|nr:flagellar export chaperone FliS [Bryobacteraceae bacterium]